MHGKHRAPRNRTITLDDNERSALAHRLTRIDEPVSAQSLLGRTVCQDLFEVLPYLPSHFVDLLIIDPPYNLDKSFNTNSFKSRSGEDYAKWIDSWLAPLRSVLKPTASIYICCDWRCSAAVQGVAGRYFHVQNRITWEREKGRGALHNWKNCSEDIWFFTLSREYTFNVDAVKLKRRVLAPYTNEDGDPKDWHETEGGGFRLT
ncbi:MAG: DNA methyltransferase, partial [Planctomycetaceae bacterium]